MTRDEAKFLLQACSKDEATTSSPEVVEALSMAASDPALREWYLREQEFDASFTRQLEQAAPPPDLREKLLAHAPIQKETKPPRTSFWDYLISHQILRTTGSFAAAFALVAFISVILFEPGEATADAEVPQFFQKIRKELEENAAPAYMNNQPEELHTFLLDQGAPLPAPLPESIAALKHMGASTLKGRESPLGVLYLENESGQKFRLFIVKMDVPEFVAPDHPDMALKQFKEVAALTWYRDGKVHALVTSSPAKTLKAFRR
ncbi:MAG: hypothetical protein ACQKBT_04460 [Puniceicoccales bacterium]